MNLNKLILSALSFAMLANTASCSKSNKDSKSETNVAVTTNNSNTEVNVSTTTDNIIQSTSNTHKSNKVNDYGVIISDNTILPKSDEVYLDYSTPLNEAVLTESSTDFISLINNVRDNIIDGVKYNIISDITEVSMGSMTTYTIIDIADKTNNKEYHKSSLYGLRIDSLINNDELLSYNYAKDAYVKGSIYDVNINDINADMRLYKSIFDAPVISVKDIKINNTDMIRAEIDTNYIDEYEANKAYIYGSKSEVKYLVLINDITSMIINLKELSSNINEDYLDISKLNIDMGIDTDTKSETYINEESINESETDINEETTTNID